MPRTGIAIFTLLWWFVAELFLLNVNTEAQVAKYAIAKKNTETEINKLKPPTKGATIAATRAVTL